MVTTMDKVFTPMECSFQGVCSSLSRVQLSATHGLLPTRLLCPWDYPGKNTEVGYHSLLQRDLPNPGVKPRSPALQEDSLPSEPPG